MNGKKCLNCGSVSIYITSEDSFLCMDCKHYHEITHRKVDGLSWWLWNREYKRYLIEKANRKEV